MLTCQHWIAWAGRDATRPALFVFSLIILLTTPALAASDPSNMRPAPIAQAFDDDCGVAALRTLFRAAGVDISHGELISGLGPEARGDALTGTNLIEMTRHSGRGFELDVGFISASGLHALTGRESLIILMRPRSFGGADGFDHFVVIERRLERGYMVVDSVLTRRAVLSESLILRDAHGKMVNGRKYILVFRLARGSAAAAPSLAPHPDDESLRPWEDLYRLPRALPPGKWSTSTSIIRTASNLAVAEGPNIREETLAKRLVITRGIGRGNQLSLELLAMDGATRLSLPTDSFLAEGQGGSSASAVWTAFHDWPLPFEFTATTNIRATWSQFGGPDLISVAFQTSRRINNLNLTLEIEASIDLHRGDLFVSTMPAISYEIPLKWGITVGGAASVPFPELHMPDQLYVGAFVSKNISPNVAVAFYFERGLLRPQGVAHSQFGVTLTLGVPRPMRLSRAAGH